VVQGGKADSAQSRGRQKELFPTLIDIGLLVLLQYEKCSVIAQSSLDYWLMAYVLLSADMQSLP